MQASSKLPGNATLALTALLLSACAMNRDAPPAPDRAPGAGEAPAAQQGEPPAGERRCRVELSVRPDGLFLRSVGDNSTFIVWDATTYPYPARYDIDIEVAPRYIATEDLCLAGGSPSGITLHRMNKGDDAVDNVLVFLPELPFEVSDVREVEGGWLVGFQEPARRLSPPDPAYYVQAADRFSYYFDIGELSRNPFESAQMNVYPSPEATPGLTLEYGPFSSREEAVEAVERLKALAPREFSVVERRFEDPGGDG